MESFADSETPLDISEVSRGSIRFNMVAMTANSLENSDLRVSESPPPPTPETRQPTIRFRREKIVVGEIEERKDGGERKGR